MLLPSSHGDSKYRLETFQRKRRQRLLSLYVTLFLVAIFLVHAWRQSHSRQSTTKRPKINAELAAYEEEISNLRQTIEELKEKTKDRRVKVPYDHRLGAVIQPSETIDPEDELFDRMLVFDNFVPPSVVSCTGNNATDRVCRIKNFCFDPTRNLFFILKNGATIVQNGKQGNETRLVDGTSIDGHNRFFIDYVESDPSTLLNKPVHWVDRVTYIMARFHRLNIMHTLHDDFMGLYNMAKLYGPANKEDPTAPFSLDTNIFFSDWYGKENYDYLYRMITKNPLQFRSEWRKQTTNPLCFAEAIVGNSKHTTWYNYGFLEPQGPIKNKQVEGLHVRDAARYIMRRVGVAGWHQHINKPVHERLFKEAIKRMASPGNPALKNHHLVPANEHYYVTIFLRQRDRLLLNFKEIEVALMKTYGLQVKTVRMEDQSMVEQIMILRTTMVAVGLHGSALIMGMFLPPGAVMVELFPYAVPAENYTPYKTMCQLPGMRIVYKAWTNKHKKNNRAHPERVPELGGLTHLEAPERERIEQLETVPPHLCCRDPTWLYRIYQDTIVDVDELLSVIDEGIIEADAQFSHTDHHFYSLIPSAPDHIECEVLPRLPLGSKEAAEAEENPLDLTISWSRPWNGVQTSRFGVWIHQHFAEFHTDGSNQFVLQNCSPGTTYDLWVRAYSPDGKTPGLYSDKHQCTCSIGATASRVDKSKSA